MTIVAAILMMAQLAQPIARDGYLHSLIEKQLDEQHVFLSGSGSMASVSTSVQPTYLQVSDNDARMVMKIEVATGHVSFGEGFTPDEATKRFADALEKMSGIRLAACPPVKEKP